LQTRIRRRRSRSVTSYRCTPALVWSITSTSPDGTAGKTNS
jgi:hypothetical protein